ncbi:hypothetical protein GBF38_001340 [Nibea albiflora]|uniref:Uncharacterized protein n=1 Tax=Nibea albiflora TaxID=240163 RepID=A0ACB7ETG0_NIBAL|nr:hypothetical protein GBF38_001340 [Nibea albiflora]
MLSARRRQREAGCSELEDRKLVGFIEEFRKYSRKASSGHNNLKAVTTCEAGEVMSVYSFMSDSTFYPTRTRFSQEGKTW